MSANKFVVCFLALAAAACAFLAVRRHSQAPARLPGSAVPSPAWNARPVHTPSVSARQPKIENLPLPPAGLRAPQAADVRPGIAKLSIPMTFEPNVGQIGAPVAYVGRGKGLTVFLTSREIAVRLASPAGPPLQNTNPRSARAGHSSGAIMTLRVAGNEKFSWSGGDELPGRSNYFIGNDPQKWRTGVPHFARVEAPGSSHGVGMSVYGNDEGLEYDLRVAPAADVSKLRLTLTGARDARIDAAGNLLLRVGDAELKMKKPKVYAESHPSWHSSSPRKHSAVGARRARKYSPRRTQRTPNPKAARKNSRPHRPKNPCAPTPPRNGQTTTSPRDIPCPSSSGARPGIRSQSGRPAIDAGYVIEADGSIGFRVGPHDPHATLVLDPSLSVAYSTFLGGTGTDTAASIAVDSAGKLYVGGTTTSTGFPGSPSSRLGPADGPALFFIAKIDPALTGASSLIYLTFFGGSGTQAGGLIAVDASGDVAITGTTTATDFPVTDTSQPTSGLATGDGNDAIVSEIGPAGNTLIFSTLFGGSGALSQSGPGGIALDSSGDVYISSDVQTTQVDSASADLPVTSGAFQTAWDGEPGDAFLAVFTPPATAGGAAVLKYCSYLGTESNAPPGVGGVAVDPSGNAYIAGFTSNGVNPFPAKNAIQTAYGGGQSDAFLMKISPNGDGADDLVFATLLGGSGPDRARAVALDSSNPPNAYLTGTTGSPNFPANGAVGAYKTTLQTTGATNAFLSVVSQNAISGQASLAYSTYFGGSHVDSGQGIAVAAPSAVYVTGATTSPDLPWHDNLQPFNGAGDAFLTKWDTTSPGAASLLYVTPLGGTSPAGGSASATGNAVAADQNGHLYVAGASTSADFPTAVTTQSALTGFQPVCDSCQLVPPLPDAFVAEIAESATPEPSVYFNVGNVPFPAVNVGTAAVPQLVAVHNGGEADLTISSIEISGTNAADFSLIGGNSCTNSAIGPGSATMCSFEVGFTPSIAGPEVAVVAVSDNAPGSPQILELVAAGQPLLASISPSTVNFGDQPENSTSAAQAITVTNVGNANLTISNITEAGADTGQFAVVPGGAAGNSPCQSGMILAANRSCEIEFSFTPNALRTFSAQVEFFYASAQPPDTEQIVPLTGVGTAASPEVAFSSPSLVFGSQNVGSRSNAQSVTLMNQGSATLDVSSIAITGASAADFAIASAGTTCPLAGGTLPVQASCTVAVQLAPQSPGPKNASLGFTDNAAMSPQQVSLSGSATAGASLQVSPASLTFAAQSQGIASAVQIVTIANSGGAAEVSGILISGPNAADFSSPSSCTPNPVPAGTSCQIGVTFTPGPGAAGTRSASLTVPNATPSTVALSGTAAQPAISVPTSIAFGSQLAGGAGGSPQPIVVTNTSSGPSGGALTISSVTRAGTNPGDFALSMDGCTGTNTPPGGTCTIQVAFKPLQSLACGANGGARSATLVLNDNAPGSPQSIPLSGTAMDFCINVPAGQAVVEPITAGQSATYSLEINSSAGFTGSAALACAVPANLLGACMVTTTPATTPPVVQVTAASAGMFQVVVTTTAQPTVTALGNGRAPRTPPLPGSVRMRWLVAIALLVFEAWLLRRRVRAFAKFAQAGALVVACMLALAACGGGNTAPADPPPGTPAGTYTITLTATVTPSGQPAVTRTLPLSLTVLPPSSN